MKARITIRLVPHITYNITMRGMSEHRTDGKDDWEVTLLIQTPENQITKTTFRDYDKACAIRQAYKALDKARINTWIDAFMSEQLLKYGHLTQFDEELEISLWKHLERVSEGKLSREKFLELWPVKVDIHLRHKQRKLGTSPDTLFKEPKAPVKWWQFWRSNK